MSTLSDHMRAPGLSVGELQEVRRNILSENQVDVPTVKADHPSIRSLGVVSTENRALMEGTILYSC